jgi:uncharacterized iron-regulated membrane protein
MRGPCLSTGDMIETGRRNLTVWQRWLDRPEQFSVRQILFQVHFWVGAIAGAYILLMSVTGSLLVYRNDLSTKFSVERLVDLHANLLAGSTGRVVNGVGALSLTLLCLTGAVIWWPGITHWRRSLTVDWHAHFARINWDLHSALGFWCFVFVLVWGISGAYLAFPQPFNMLFVLDPADRFTDATLFWLSQLHFGRLGSFVQALWAILGLVPAVLSFTGVFICCRRVIFKRPSNPKSASH